MLRLFAGILFLFLPVVVHGEEIAVRIFSKTKPLTFVFTPVTGSFTIKCSGQKDVLVKINEPVIISRYENRVLYKTMDGVSRLTDTIHVIPGNKDNIFTVRQPENREARKKLKGSLKIYRFPGSLMILNIVDIETYLPGAVRAEAGSKGPVEYFKTQSIIARTYIYRHLDRHKLDGYNLCDDIHCQVFSGIIAEQPIVDACNLTRGLVLVDKDSTLIISAFHANCGGQTASSSDVWVTPEPYLVPVKDPYCVKGKPKEWECKIPVAAWKKFLSSKGLSYKTDTVSIPSSGIPSRQAYFNIYGKKIQSTEIRDRFNLKSAYFAINIKGDDILVKGKGYGHGVGLCQDGAMVMASNGLSYNAITKFYFPGTSVINVKYAHLPEKP